MDGCNHFLSHGLFCRPRSHLCFRSRKYRLERRGKEFLEAPVEYGLLLDPVGIQDSQSSSETRFCQRKKQGEMRVLYVYNQYRGGGGADNTTGVTIDLSRKHGLDVEVFTRTSNDMRHGFFARALDAANGLYQRESLRQFQKVVESFKPDVVQIYKLFPMISPWIVPFCSKQGIPVVMSVYDYGITCPITTHFRNGAVCTRCTTGQEYWPILLNCRNNLQESMAMAAYRAVTRKSQIFTRYVSHFVTPSQFTRQWLIHNLGIPPESITTIELAVALAATAADPAAGSYIAFAGRFAPEKGIDLLLQAARIAGLPVRLSRNSRMLERYSMPADTEVVVTHTQAELDAFYRGARFSVVPSRWFESFGLVGAESMSHGIPVIASRIGALEYLFEDGVEGIYFETGNAADLARQMKRLWNDPELCRKLGVAARKRVARAWSPEIHFRQHLAVYENVCRR
jgi:glycosyltransferase involved in cell wall biosynthesis